MSCIVCGKDRLLTIEASIGIELCDQHHYDVMRLLRKKEHTAGNWLRALATVMDRRRWLATITDMGDLANEISTYLDQHGNLIATEFTIDWTNLYVVEAET